MVWSPRRPPARIRAKKGRATQSSSQRDAQRWSLKSAKGGGSWWRLRMDLSWRGRSRALTAFCFLGSWSWSWSQPVLCWFWFARSSRVVYTQLVVDRPEGRPWLHVYEIDPGHANWVRGNNGRWGMVRCNTVRADEGRWEGRRWYALRCDGRGRERLRFEIWWRRNTWGMRCGFVAPQNLQPAVDWPKLLTNWPTEPEGSVTFRLQKNVCICVYNYAACRSD